MLRRREEETSGLGLPKEDFADAALRLEAAEQQKREAEAEAQRQKEMSTYKSYMEEIAYFQAHLEVYKEQREQEEEEQRHAEELRQIARQERMQALEAKKQSRVSNLLKWRRG